MGDPLSAGLVLCAKSPWEPAIRREHALARLAAARGVDVVYLQPPDDIRAAGGGGWVRALRGAELPGSAGSAAPVPGRGGSPGGGGSPGREVRRWRRSAPVPAHRSAAAAAVDSRLLDHCLRQVAGADDALVAMLPWQWPAVARSGAGRRVFDCADDWSALLPDRAEWIRRGYRRVAAEADRIVVASPLLAPLFAGRPVTVVPNGTDSALLTALPTPRPGRRRLVYVGTLSERFDADLVGAVLDRLPDWTLTLYGQSRYARSGDLPAPELRRLLDRPGGQVRWPGLVARADLAAVLDGADVLVVPNRAARSRGQSSMKLYDYAARGRPVVATPAVPDAACAPPGLLLAEGPAAFAAAVLAADAEPASAGVASAAWAARQTWSDRWPAWSAALLGHPAPARSDLAGAGR